MIQLGYLKDCLAPFLFLFLIYKLYFLNIYNNNYIKKELIIYFCIGLFTDFLFTIFPNFHYTNVGYNLFTYIFIFMAILVIINFLYFNNQLFNMT